MQCLHVYLGSCCGNRFPAVSTVQGSWFAGVSRHGGPLLFNVLFCFKSALLDLGVTDHFTEEGEFTHLAINWAHG